MDTGVRNFFRKAMKQACVNRVLIILPCANPVPPYSNNLSYITRVVSIYYPERRVQLELLFQLVLPSPISLA